MSKKTNQALTFFIPTPPENNLGAIYFDTGIDNYKLQIKNLLDNVNPHLIIGPFTREALLIIKPFVKSKSIPMFTFSNDIALIEKNIWSLGFSPEEQVESIVSCALKNGKNRFGSIPKYLTN